MGILTKFSIRAFFIVDNVRTSLWLFVDQTLLLSFLFLLHLNSGLLLFLFMLFLCNFDIVLNLFFWMSVFTISFNRTITAIPAHSHFLFCKHFFLFHFQIINAFLLLCSFMFLFNQLDFEDWMRKFAGLWVFFWTLNFITSVSA